MEVDNPQMKNPDKKVDPEIPGLKGTGKDMDPILIQQKMLACDDASQLVEYQWPLEGVFFLEGILVKFVYIYFFSLDIFLSFCH